MLQNRLIRREFKTTLTGAEKAIAAGLPPSIGLEAELKQPG